LVDHFLKDAAERFKREPKPLTPDAMRACVAHAWKGNVRELRSSIEQALLLAPGTEITERDLFGAGANGDSSALAAAIADAGPTPFREAKDRLVADFEKSFLVAALKRNAGNITKAAEEIGMYRQNLQQKMRELGITPDE